tara:strand:- start:6237 stop:6578 length:342 start_codon:yes stop_codon:yes gene_type:complete
MHPEGGDHISVQPKYFCEVSDISKLRDKLTDIHPLCAMGHELTRDNFYTLAGQVASLVQYGDKVKTIDHQVIDVGDLIAGEYCADIILKIPLSVDELRILSAQILDDMRKRNE